MIERYGLGLPIWGSRSWHGSLYSRDAKASDRLGEYASVFNSVEGNPTFYAIPTPQRLAAWAAQTPPGFGFSFKVPRAITHDRGLVDAEVETRMFLDALDAARSRLGPTMLQLPPRFGRAQLPTLAAYLDTLPRWLDVAVELRHPTLFSEQWVTDVDALLAEHGADRVVLDSRPLRASAVHEPEAEKARQRKPDLPVWPQQLGDQPVVRLIADPDLPANAPWLEEWADRFTAWIAEGRRPVLFIHLPGDTGAPQLARTWHAMLRERGAPVGAMPPWPGEAEPRADTATPPVQPKLFGDETDGV